MNRPAETPKADSHNEPPFEMNVERRANVAIVRLSGSCSMEVAGGLGQRLVRLASGSINLIVLDLSKLAFIESTGLGGIIAGHLRLRHRHGEVRLVAPREPILEVLKLTRLNQLFRICRTVDEAVSLPPTGP